MRLAYSVDPVDVWMIAVLLLAYSLAFCTLFAVSKIRERRWLASHKERLDQLRGKPIDAPRSAHLLRRHLMNRKSRVAVDSRLG
jgi:uncharacterized membrane protein YqhA